MVQTRSTGVTLYTDVCIYCHVMDCKIVFFFIYKYFPYICSLYENTVVEFQCLRKTQTLGTIIIRLNTRSYNVRRLTLEQCVKSCIQFIQMRWICGFAFLAPKQRFITFDHRS